MKTTKNLSQLIEAQIANENLAPIVEMIRLQAPSMPASLVLTFIWDFNSELSQN
jgi:hypothetical protein